jgi:drug/metabolite transporter superfamily protein YnfA
METVMPVVTAPVATTSATSATRQMIGAATGAALAYLVLLSRGWSPINSGTVLRVVVAALVGAGIGRPWRHTARMALEWSPLFVALWAYDMARRHADEVGRAVAVHGPIHIERTLFFGHLPTNWFFGTLGHVRTPWMSIPFDLIWISHFFVPLGLAGVLWVRNRRLYATYAVATCLMMLIAVVVFTLQPTAPPWYAAQQGLVNASRTIGQGFRSMGVDFIAANMAKGTNSANPFAAIPSLHTGYSLLVAYVLARHVETTRGRRWSMLFFLYPLAMMTTLVANGEHYVTDCLVAVPVVALAWWSAQRIVRRIDRRPVDDAAQQELVSVA